MTLSFLHLSVQPATLLRWHSDLVAKRWTYASSRYVTAYERITGRLLSNWHGVAG